MKFALWLCNFQSQKYKSSLEAGPHNRSDKSGMSKVVNPAPAIFVGKIINDYDL